MFKVICLEDDPPSTEGTRCEHWPPVNSRALSRSKGLSENHVIKTPVSLSPIHIADAYATKLSSCVARVGGVYWALATL